MSSIGFYRSVHAEITPEFAPRIVAILFSTLAVYAERKSMIAAEKAVIQWCTEGISLSDCMIAAGSTPLCMYVYVCVCVELIHSAVMFMFFSSFC